MKVLFYCLRAIGGGFANIQLLLEALARDYPRDEYVLIGMEGMSFGEVEGRPNVGRITVSVGLHIELARLRLGWWGLHRLVEETRPDLLWCINLGPYRRTRVPSLLSLHNAHQVYPLSATREHPRNRLYVGAMRYCFRRSVACADGVLAQTNLMADYARRIPGAPKQVRVVSKAVETEAEVKGEPLPAALLESLRTGPLRNAFTFLYVATALPHKNHRLLIEVFDQLAAQSIRARLVLTVSAVEATAIGGEKAARLMRSGHLIAAGWTPKPQLRALYEACNACLMPSLLESLSSAHLEAMCWKKPQVSADLPYARGLCGEASLYAEAASAPEWAARIEQLMGDAALRDRLVQAGTERMRQFPSSWAETAAQVRQFMEEVRVAGGVRLNQEKSGRMPSRSPSPP